MRVLTPKQAEKIKLDLKDKKILNLLSKDVRTSLNEIARKIQFSRDSVNYRIKNYEKKEIITGYRANIALSNFGYEAFHLFLRLNNPSAESQKELINKLKTLEYILAILKITGTYDY